MKIWNFTSNVPCALYVAPVIPNILYKVRVHENSTTKTDYSSLNTGTPF